MLLRWLRTTGCARRTVTDGGRRPTITSSKCCCRLLATHGDQQLNLNWVNQHRRWLPTMLVQLLLCVKLLLYTSRKPSHTPNLWRSQSQFVAPSSLEKWRLNFISFSSSSCRKLRWSLIILVVVDIWSNSFDKDIFPTVHVYTITYTAGTTVQFAVPATNSSLVGG